MKEYPYEASPFLVPLEDRTLKQSIPVKCPVDSVDKVLGDEFWFHRGNQFHSCKSTRGEDNKMQAKRGFTLVEILIVVVILGILAAIVIPQFTQASTEARLTSLASDLQTLRSQIELYQVQHNDVAPTFANFANQMVYCSTPAGVTSTTKQRDATYTLGPYLQTVPENPFTRTATLRDIADPCDAGAGGATAGWAYVEETGEIRADDSVAHAAY